MRTKARLALGLNEDPFFSLLSPEVRTRIEDFVHFRAYECRQIIYFADDVCDQVFWVREGRLRVTRVSDSKKELTYRHLFAGDMMGTECLIGATKRGTFGEALAASVLGIMLASDFLRILREENEFAFLVNRCLAERLSEVEQVLADTVFKTVRQRIASRLYRLYRHESRKTQYKVSVTHQELASLSGTARETTTTVLRGLQDDGILTIGNRQLTVIEPAALERAARSG